MPNNTPNERTVGGRGMEVSPVWEETKKITERLESLFSS